jgi:hypothetical protein
LESKSISLSRRTSRDGLLFLKLGRKGKSHNAWNYGITVRSDDPEASESEEEGGKDTGLEGATSEPS